MQTKRAVLEESLARHLTHIYLDARLTDVQVPEKYRQGDLRLNLSHLFNNSNMEITDKTVSATLTFSGQGFRCVIPWRAIWAIGSKSVGLMWEESVPLDVQARMTRQDAKLDIQPMRPAKTASLALVTPALPDTEADEPMQNDPDEAAPVDETPNKRPPWLRLVKD